MYEKPKGGTMRIIVIILAVFGTMAWVVPSSYGRVDVNINIGVPVPPAISVEAPPEMVIIPEAGVYVAVGTPYDLYFLNGRYYYFHGGYWYGARGYGGPWTHVEDRRLPPGLRRYKIERLHEFREHAWKEYHERGPKFGGKHFRAEEREIAKERRQGRKDERKEHGGPGRHGRE
jgi:hypothetical protein